MSSTKVEAPRAGDAGTTPHEPQSGQQLAPPVWARLALLQWSVFGLIALDVVLRTAGGSMGVATPYVWEGLTLVSLALLLVTFVPLEHHGRRFLVLISLLDLAAIGLVRLTPEDGGAAVLVVLPAIWIGAVWGRGAAVPIGLATGLLVTLPAYLYAGLRRCTASRDRLRRRVRGGRGTAAGCSIASP